jgi:hypothetical protein
MVVIKGNAGRLRDNIKGCAKPARRPFSNIPRFHPDRGAEE